MEDGDITWYNINKSAENHSETEDVPVGHGGHGSVQYIVPACWLPSIEHNNEKNTGVTYRKMWKTMENPRFPVGNIIYLK